MNEGWKWSHLPEPAHLIWTTPKVFPSSALILNKYLFGRLTASSLRLTDLALPASRKLLSFISLWTIFLTIHNQLLKSNLIVSNLSLWKTSGTSNYSSINSLLQTLVTSAGFNTPDTWNHLCRSTAFLIFTTRFSTHDQQHFFFPLIQHRATSEPVKQKYSSMQPWQQILLDPNTYSRIYPQEVLGETSSIFFERITFVLEVKKLTRTPKSVTIRK